MSIKCGFFDAENFTEETIEGQTVLVPDRAYSPSDFNTYFDNIISTTGAFYISSDKSQYPFRVSVMDDSDIDPEDPGYTANCFKVVIYPGAGRINGHYVSITSPEILWVGHGTAGYRRADRIVLRLDESDRSIKPAVLVGKNIEEEDVNINDSLIATTPSYERWVKGETHESGIYDIGLATITINSGVTSSDDVKSMVLSTVGNVDHCPWITHLVYGAKTESELNDQVDAWLNGYATYFTEWFNNVVNNLELSTNIRTFAKEIAGNDPATTQWNLETLFTSEGYKFNEGDVFEIYYNNLRLIPGTDYEINGDGDLTLRGGQSMRPGNTLFVHIIKSQVGIPSYVNGDDKLY